MDELTEGQKIAIAWLNEDDDREGLARQIDSGIREAVRQRLKPKRFFDGLNGDEAQLHDEFEKYMSAIAPDDSALPDKQRIRRFRRRIARQEEIIGRLIQALAARNR